MARVIDKDYLLKHKRKVRFFGIGPDDESWGYAVPAEIIENAPTITQSNKPLTLEQLLEMNGKPVWTKLLVESTGRKEGWTLVYNDDRHAAVQRWTQFPLWYKDYGKTWLAYAYHPVHIDREKWEPCMNCKDIEKIAKHIKYCPSYCPVCGRPITDEAWDELEKRMRGM